MSKRITVEGLIPDGSGGLKPVRIEITDPDLIAKIQNGFINDLSLEVKPAVHQGDGRASIVPVEIRRIDSFPVAPPIPVEASDGPPADFDG